MLIIQKLLVILENRLIIKVQYSLMNNNKNNMSNNYKIVNVYINYNENSINKIDSIKSEFGVDDVV